MNPIIHKTTIYCIVTDNIYRKDVHHKLRRQVIMQVSEIIMNLAVLNIYSNAVYSI